MFDSIEILLSPFITLLVVQSIKLATDHIKGNFTFHDFVMAYGGMPSSHTAVVTSLTAIVAYHDGFNSLSFAIALVFSLIVITDALILRKFIDQQSQAIKQLISFLPPDKQREVQASPRRIEHTVPQVLVGALIGFTIATIIHLI